MKIYSVHTLAWSAADDGDAVFVKEGFCWPAFVFGALWSLWRGMWVASAVLFGIALGLGAAADLAGLDEAMAAVLQFALQVGAGLFGNDMRRWSLRRAGYVENAVVAAPRRIDAEHRYFTSLLSGRNVWQAARP